MSDTKNTVKHDEIGNDQLAAALGISVEQLNKLNWTIDADMNADPLIYEVIVRFSDDSSMDILDKIQGLGENKTVRLSPTLLS